MTIFSVKRRGGTESQHNNFTGAPRELTVDTTNWNIRVHDGSTTGGYRTSMVESGSTANRPSNPVVGQDYFDTSLGHSIWWNGSNWVHASGTSV